MAKALRAVSVAVTEAYPPRQPEEACGVVQVRLEDGREFSVLTATPAWFEKTFAELGLRYLHFKDLAPSQALRERQKAADRAERTAKRQRAGLSELFVTGYREECLGAFDSRGFIGQLGPEARIVALFCVERAPAACHRSLVAERLQRDLGLEVVHLTPE